MGIRPSDARWLERDVIPLLESLAPTLDTVPTINLDATLPMCPTTYTFSSQAVAEAVAARAALRTQLAETTAAAKRRLEGRPKPASAELHRMSRNPTVEHYSADVDGWKVPYIDIVRWPCVWTESGCAEQVYPQIEWVEEVSTTGGVVDATGLHAHGYTPKVLWDGDWCWTVEINNVCWDFDSREDVEMILPVLAKGMAVAAGFTSHGAHSFPRNAHGPAVGLAPFTDPMPIATELLEVEGMNPKAIADAVVTRLTGLGYNAPPDTLA
jgi:hypothetical protein